MNTIYLFPYRPCVFIENSGSVDCPTGLANYFYPDFIVCLEYPDEQSSESHMLETKHDAKDASKKAQHRPQSYGKVLFVTKDNTRLRIVNDDGSLGADFDWVDLTPAWQWIPATRH
ncbi:hypothetical protein [Herbaspirillum autotrophicum]|uniref:hypothetical protein n=1 Tax=Herbaspirillum autotrophicum TaxID=180195 RepID=UPI0012ED5E67|nr:hypothetical protein [Herbaspirillum autotrophicum]